jgi:hypothetical protein
MYQMCPKGSFIPPRLSQSSLSSTGINSIVPAAMTLWNTASST